MTSDSLIEPMLNSNMLDLVDRRSVKKRLEDIWNALDRIQRYTKDLSQEALEENLLSQDAIVWNLMVINQATRQIPQKVKGHYRQVDWQRLHNLECELVPGTFEDLSVGPALQMIARNLPDWKRQVRKIITNKV